MLMPVGCIYNTQNVYMYKGAKLIEKKLGNRLLTDKTIVTGRLDKIIIDKLNKIIYFIDFAVQSDHDIHNSGIEKYKPLAQE